MADKKRILKKLDEMDSYLKELHGALPKDFQEYMDSTEKRRACERVLHISIECVIDILSQISKDLKTGTPADEEDMFDKLEKKGIISKQLSVTLKTMKGFRNILVHRYAEVEDELVFEFLKNNLKDFSAFKKEVLKFLKSTLK